MRQRWTVVPTLIVLGLGLCGFRQHAFAEGGFLDDCLGQRAVVILLLTRPDIQADLRLSREQATACDRAAAAFQNRAALLKGRKDPGALPARRAIDEMLARWLIEHLSPKQAGRLDQIDLQWEGAAAMLTRPFLQESLALTEDQKAKLRACLAEGRARRAQGDWSYEDHLTETRRATALLDDRQRKLWVDLLGPPCRFNIAAKAQPPQRRAPGPANPGRSPASH